MTGSDAALDSVIKASKAWLVNQYFSKFVKQGLPEAEARAKSQQRLRDIEFSQAGSSIFHVMAEEYLASVRSGGVANPDWGALLAKLNERRHNESRMPPKPPNDNNQCTNIANSSVTNSSNVMSYTNNGMSYGNNNSSNANTNMSYRNNGMSYTNNSVSNANNGMSNANNGMSNANNGMSNANNGMSNANNGMSNANNGMSNANNGMSNANNGMSNANNGMSNANNGMSNTNNGMSNTINGMDNANNSMGMNDPNNSNENSQVKHQPDGVISNEGNSFNPVMQDANNASTNNTNKYYSMMNNAYNTMGNTNVNIQAQGMNQQSMQGSYMPNQYMQYQYMQYPQMQYQMYQQTNPLQANILQEATGGNYSQFTYNKSQQNSAAMQNIAAHQASLVMQQNMTFQQQNMIYNPAMNHLNVASNNRGGNQRRTGIGGNTLDFVELPLQPPPPPDDFRNFDRADGVKFCKISVGGASVSHQRVNKEAGESSDSSVEDVSKEFTQFQNTKNEISLPKALSRLNQEFEKLIKESLKLVPHKVKDQGQYKKAYRRLFRKQYSICEEIVQKKINNQSSKGKSSINSIVKTAIRIAKIPTDDEVWKEMGLKSQTSKISDRIQRFQTEKVGLDWRAKLELMCSSEQVIGKSEQLEKSYLRLTTAADPANVRPERVLKNSLPHIIKEYEARGHNWKYLEDQLRSIRQDMAVQGIRTEFTVTVYEENCRKALIHSDMGQFNQAQTQLFYLYLDALQSGKTSWLTNFDEFTTYRIMYLMFNEIWPVFLSTRMTLVLHNCEGKGTLFALECHKTMRDGNIRRFFKLIPKSPYPHVKPIVDAYKARIRMTNLIVLCKSSLSISIVCISDMLGFKNKSECKSWIQEQKEIEPFMARNDGETYIYTTVQGNSLIPLLQKSNLLKKYRVIMGIT